MNSNSKWIGRSRQVWAISSVALFAVVGAARQMGAELPMGLEEKIDGLVQALLGSVAAGLALWSLFRPDNARLTLIPSDKNVGTGLTGIYPGAGTLGCLMLAVLLGGCASNDITVYRMVLGEPEPMLRVEQGFSGKGCIAVDSDPTTGKSSVIVQQAGTSDWGIPRMFSWIADVAGSMPIIGGGGQRGMTEPQGPTAGMQGCEGIFGGAEQGYDPPPPPDTLYRVTPAPED